MPFIYHIVPDNFSGDTIYPLNKLENISPDLHSHYKERYKNREHVQQLFVPQLNAYWGDVVHLARCTHKKLQTL